MKEIKFRAKIKNPSRAHKSEWLYGYVSKNKAGQWFMDTLDEVYVEVEENSIAEFTGETINNMDIYEGDIIKVTKLTFESSAPLPENLVVKFYGGMFQLFRGNQCLMGLHLLYLDEGEIIGNTFDNPELIAA